MMEVRDWLAPLALIVSMADVVWDPRFLFSFCSSVGQKHADQGLIFLTNDFLTNKLGV